MKTECGTTVDDKVPGNSEFVKDPVEFTDIVGGCGKWQKKLFALTTFLMVPIAWHFLAMPFLAYPQDHWCARPEGANISIEMWWDEFIPNATIKGKVQHSQCEMFSTNHSNGRPIVITSEPCSSWEYSRDFNSVIQKWDLGCKKEWMISMSQSVYMVGVLFAGSFSGQLADLFGRHPVTILNVFIFIIAGITAAFSNSFTMFIICRFFIGFGCAGMDLVVHIICVEILASEYRAKCTSVRYFGWIFGYMLLPLMAWIVSDWFYLQLAISLPCLLILSFIWLLPESPRWLLSAGKIEKAVSLMKVAAQENGKTTDGLEEKAKKISYREQKEKEKSKATFIDLLRTPKLRRNTFSLYFVWIAVTFTYYGLSLNSNELEGNHYLNFFLSGLVEIPSIFYCFFTLDRFGRKKPFIFSIFVSGLSCICCAVIPKSYASINTASALFGKCFISAAFGVIYIYSAEIFPTVVRNIGVGSCSTMARIGASIAPFMKDLGKITDPSVPQLLFGIVSIISGGLVFFLPETNLLPVPETIEQVENTEQ